MQVNFSIEYTRIGILERKQRTWKIMIYLRDIDEILEFLLLRIQDIFNAYSKSIIDIIT